MSENNLEQGSNKSVCNSEKSDSRSRSRRRDNIENNESIENKQNIENIESKEIKESDNNMEVIHIDDTEEIQNQPEQQQNTEYEPDNQNINNPNNQGQYNDSIQNNQMQNQENLILDYTSTNTLYSISFQNTNVCRLALGTLEMNPNLANRIEIVQTMKEDNIDIIKKICSEEISFPTSKLMWTPNKTHNNLLAASSDIIRLYKFDEETDSLTLSTSLNNKKSQYCEPLTSFDWNRENNSILGTSSIDTTCTIWDLNKNTIRTQLIAHDKEVYDIAFSKEEQIFISTGADGSIRLFDLRSLEHSTIIFESKDHIPITKVAWNVNDNYYISAISEDKNFVYVIDTRNTNQAMELTSHTSAVSSMAWAPHSNSHICSVGEDKFVFIWDIQRNLANSFDGPILSYCAPGEINNVSWSEMQVNWIGIIFNNNLQLLKI